MSFLGQNVFQTLAILSQFQVSTLVAGRDTSVFRDGVHRGRRPDGSADPFRRLRRAAVTVLRLGTCFGDRERAQDGLHSPRHQARQRAH